MKFNPEISKQAIEVIFSAKYKKPFHPHLDFNGIPVARETSTKHLGIILDERLTFRKHIKEAISKAKKGLSLMRFLSKYLTPKILDQTYKMYVRPHLEYGDVIFHDQLADMMDSLESIQYQAGLIVSNCWRGTNKVKLYKELGWESLHDRRIFRRFSLYYKILNDETPMYLKDHIHPLPPRRTLRYERSFFPFCQLNWDSIDDNIKNSDNISQFKSRYLKGIRPPPSGFFGIDDKYGVRLLFKLRVDFSDLRRHRFDHKFNCLSPICSCTLEEESTEHFLTRCPLFSSQRRILTSSISTILRNDFSVLPDDYTSRIILYGSESFNIITNNLIIRSTIRYIRSTKRFNKLEAFTSV
jgi:hypothetical protein